MLVAILIGNYPFFFLFQLLHILSPLIMLQILYLMKPLTYTQQFSSFHLFFLRNSFYSFFYNILMHAKGFDFNFECQLQFWLEVILLFFFFFLKCSTLSPHYLWYATTCSFISWNHSRPLIIAFQGSTFSFLKNSFHSFYTT